jgi:hypothetical protein
MPCYGLEQNPYNPQCPACPHKRSCAELMGDLADRVKVTEAKFRFMPPALERRYTTDDSFRLDIDRENVEKVYAFCYEWVFAKKPRRGLGSLKPLVLTRVRLAETSIKLFFLSNLYGWRQSHQTEFHPKLLTTDRAMRVFREYASACETRYGVFDTTSLDKLTAREGDAASIEDRLYHSEVIAGSWVVNYKLFHSGGLAPKLYRECEEALHPYWLAIEPSYYTWVFHDHLEFPDPHLTATTKNHRCNVAHILAKLKTHPRDAFMVFTLRERIMPRAVATVLSARNFKPEDFLIHDDYPVTNSIKFWVQLASAIQQWECLKFVNKLPSAFNHFRIGSAQ